MAGDTKHDQILKAAREGWLGQLVNLLDEGVSIETKDNSGDSLLNEAARCGHMSVVRLLVERGAQLHSPNSSGKTAEKWALEGHHSTIVSFLQEEAAGIQLKATQPSQEWVLMSDATVGYISTYPRQYRKITEIFNLASRERLIISENLASKAESIAPPTSFDDLGQDRLKLVAEEAKKLGCTVDEGYILRGTKQIKKNNMG
jgi:hypothetical protein